MTCECWALGAPVIYLCTHRSQSLISSSLRSELCGSVAQSSTEPGTRTQQCLSCISKRKARGGRKFLHPRIAQSQRNQGYCSFGEIIKSSVVFQSHGWCFIVISAACWHKAACCEQRAGCSTPTIALGSMMSTPTRIFPLELAVSL